MRVHLIFNQAVVLRNMHYYIYIGSQLQRQLQEVRAFGISGGDQGGGGGGVKRGGGCFAVRLISTDVVISKSAFREVVCG